MSTLNGFIGLGTHLTDGILVEPLASQGYARAAIGVDRFLSGAGVNNAVLSFGPNVVSDWGTLAYAALFDQAGNQIQTWSISPITVSVAGNNIVQIAAGAIGIRLGPAWAADLTLDANGRITYASNNEPVRH